MITEQDLQQIPIFHALESDELQALTSTLKEKSAPKNSFLVYANDDAKNIMFLAHGKAKVTLSSKEGKEVILAYLCKGDFFGELALLTGEDRSADVIALSECRIFVLAPDDFKNHIIKYRGLSFAMMSELAQRLRAASAKIADLALYDVFRRVARALKSLGVKESKDGEEILLIKERPTHQELASLVGTSREMVTRALKGLEDDGCIVINGKQIEIWKLPV